MITDGLARTVLDAAFRHRLVAPDADTGIAALAEAAAATTAPAADWREAVAAVVRDGLVYDPVRLPEGALQCHWHLELTPKGVALLCGTQPG